MKVKKNPKPIEYDDTGGIVDIFVRRDPECPYPFHEDDWYHQGFYLKEFVRMLNRFFERNKLNYRVVDYKR